MLASPNFVREIVLLQPLSIPFDEVSAVRDLLEELGPGFNPGNLQRQSILAADMLEWCIRIVRAYYTATANYRNGGREEYGFDPNGDGSYSDMGDEEDDDQFAEAGEHYPMGERRGHASQTKYGKGTAGRSLPLRMLRMDPNTDYGKEGPA